MPNLAHDFTINLSKLGMKDICRLLIVGSVLITGTVFAQQDPQVSMYMFNRQFFNPAYAGAAGAPNLTLQGREQYVGIQGHPRTFNLAGSLPVKKLRGGVGGYIMGDQVGFWNTTSLNLAYAFHLPIGQNGSALQLGIQGTFSNKSLDFSKLNPAEQGDQLLMNAAGSVKSQLAPSVGAGIYFHTAEDKFYFGVSANHINSPKITEFGKETNLSLVTYVNAGYRFRLNSNGDISLTPSVLYKMTSPQSQLDFNLNLNVSPMVFGVSYRGLKNTDAILGIVGFQANERLFVAYSYDYVMNGLRSSTSGSHELIVSYTFPTIFKVYPPDRGVRDNKPFN